MNNKIGEIIKERRKAKELALAQLAGVSGVSASHIGRIERGERFPSGYTLRKLAKPLGFTEFELQKLAGFMSRDVIDDRLDRLKKEIKREIVLALANLYLKLDNL